MDREEITYALESLPVSFRVICVGKEMSGVFHSIVSLGFEGVSIQSDPEFSNTTPTDEDKMVILLADDYSQQLESIAKSFYQAGVLTLIVSSITIDNLNGICDAMTVSHNASMPFMVKSLLEPVIRHGRINYDFNDLYSTLHNREKFKIVSAISSNGENRIVDLVNNLNAFWGELTMLETESLSLILYQNKDATPPLSMSELYSLSEYIGRFPENITVIWALNYDESLQTNEIRLDAIASGKRLKL